MRWSLAIAFVLCAAVVSSCAPSSPISPVVTHSVTIPIDEDVVIPSLDIEIRVERVPSSSSAYFLDVFEDGTQKTIPLRIGESFTAGGEKYTLEGPQTIQGIVRTPNGQPVAIISFDAGGKWASGIALRRDVWSNLEMAESNALTLRWFASEEDARSAVADELDALEHGRWGVRDGDQLLWFHSFVPGTGVELHDGTIISLSEVDTVVGRVRVSALSDGVSDEHWIDVNDDDQDARFVLELPTQARNVFIVSAWGSDTVIVTKYENAQLAWCRTSTVGQALRADSGDALVIVEELARAGSLVDRDRYSVAKDLAPPQQEHHILYEGERRNIVDFDLLLRIERQYPEKQYAFRVSDASGAEGYVHGNAGEPVELSLSGRAVTLILTDDAVDEVDISIAVQEAEE